MQIGTSAKSIPLTRRLWIGILFSAMTILPLLIIDWLSTSLSPPVHYIGLAALNALIGSIIFPLLIQRTNFLDSSTADTSPLTLAPEDKVIAQGPAILLIDYDAYPCKIFVTRSLIVIKSPKLPADYSIQLHEVDRISKDQLSFYLTEKLVITTKTKDKYTLLVYDAKTWERVIRN